jgi:hypothetical protein
MKNLLKDPGICERIILNMTLDKWGEKWYTYTSGEHYLFEISNQTQSSWKKRTWMTKDKMEMPTPAASGVLA